MTLETMVGGLHAYFPNRAFYVAAAASLLALSACATVKTLSASMPSRPTISASVKNQKAKPAFFTKKSWAEGSCRGMVRETIEGKVVVVAYSYEKRKIEKEIYGEREVPIPFVTSDGRTVPFMFEEAKAAGGAIGQQEMIIGKHCHADVTVIFTNTRILFYVGGNYLAESGVPGGTEGEKLLYPGNIRYNALEFRTPALLFAETGGLESVVLLENGEVFRMSIELKKELAGQQLYTQQTLLGTVKNPDSIESLAFAEGKVVLEYKDGKKGLFGIQ